MNKKKCFFFSKYNTNIHANTHTICYLKIKIDGDIRLQEAEQKK